ncbi:MAG: hypothetical protein KF902_00410 [Phycisphaeraceae bacterium]|nr:hypothetical protein [Phycisphaeraceae bacterium]MCW5768367.1 hypothetical protein [Phycisphaeraceae bacterium]
MAGRGGAGVGMIVTVSVLGVLALTLFVLTVVFYGNYQGAKRELDANVAQMSDFVRPDERERDDIRSVRAAATQARKSVVGYLQESMQGTMRRVTGSPRDTVAQLEERIARIPGAEGSSLLQVIQDQNASISRLRDEVTQADADRQRALEDLQNESERVARMQQSHNNAVAALNAEIGTYRSEVDSYREGINDTRKDMDARVERLLTDSRDNEAKLSERIRQLQDQNLVLQNQVSQLRGEKNKDILKPEDEFALVDGQVAGLDNAGGRVFINLGRNQKVRLGMTFAVYNNATEIRPDDDGVYPRGKASIEVIAVDENSSACRILVESRGNPVVKGDVIANAVYDPRKTYKFLVWGNFDADRDGRRTPQEKMDIEAMVLAWGGEVVEELTGDVDFLVLGERPILPPPPRPGSPIEIMQEYIRLDRTVQRYNDLQNQAAATGLPVLNENRLYTLIGRY